MVSYDFTWFPRGEGEAHSETKGERENFLGQSRGEKGTEKTTDLEFPPVMILPPGPRGQTGKGKDHALGILLGSDWTTGTARTHARHETKRFSGWSHSSHPTIHKASPRF